MAPSFPSSSGWGQPQGLVQHSKGVGVKLVLSRIHPTAGEKEGRRGGGGHPPPRAWGRHSLPGWPRRGSGYGDPNSSLVSLLAALAPARRHVHPEADGRVGRAQGLGGVGGAAEVRAAPLPLPVLAAVVALENHELRRRYAALLDLGFHASASLAVRSSAASTARISSASSPRAATALKPQMAAPMTSSRRTHSTSLVARASVQPTRTVFSTLLISCQSVIRPAPPPRVGPGQSVPGRSPRKSPPPLRARILHRLRGKSARGAPAGSGGRRPGARRPGAARGSSARPYGRGSPRRALEKGRRLRLDFQLPAARLPCAHPPFPTSPRWPRLLSCCSYCPPWDVFGIQRSCTNFSWSN